MVHVGMNLPIVVLAMLKGSVSHVGDSEWPHLFSDASSKICFILAPQMTSWYLSSQEASMPTVFYSSGFETDISLTVISTEEPYVDPARW